MTVQDQNVISWLRKQPEAALQWMYDNYYNYVCGTVYRMTGDTSLAQDIAQDVFFDLWKKRETIEIRTAFKPYIRQAAVNKTLNHIRKKQLILDEEDAAAEVVSDEHSTIDLMEVDELRASIHRSIDELPEKCRIIFALSRFEHLSYQEIADKLDISKKTVENQISKALKALRMNVLSLT